MTSRHRAFLAVAVALIVLGVFAALVTMAWPGPASSLFPHSPRPTFSGTPAEAADVLTTNLTVLLVPLLLAGAAGGHLGPWRLAGDLVTATVLALNGAAVGAALALHGAALLPYLPHLPIEAAALALTGSTWLSHRRGRGPLTKVFAVVLALAAAAALIEVYATPHTSR